MINVETINLPQLFYLFFQYKPTNTQHVLSTLFSDYYLNIMSTHCYTILTKKPCKVLNVNWLLCRDISI